MFAYFYFDWFVDLQEVFNKQPIHVGNPRKSRGAGSLPQVFSEYF
jgi:hypothetical protein